MSKIVVSAPVQNKWFNPDVNPGKVVPLFVADWLQEYANDFEEHTPIHLWNNGLAAEQVGHTIDSYSAQVTARLGAKYDSELLGHLRDRQYRPLVLSDSQPDFLAWAGQKVDSAIEKGDLQVKDIGVFVCGHCDATLAAAAGPKPADCVTCPEKTDIFAVQRPTMVATLSPETYAKVDAATKTRANSQPIFGDSIVSKRRLGGISLEKYGFEDDVVDPRITVGLLVAFAGVIGEANTVNVVASRATLRQNLPQYFAAMAGQGDAVPAINMIGIAKAPADYLIHLRDEGVLSNLALANVLRNKLPPALLTMRHDMTPQTAEQLIFGRNINNYCKNTFNVS